MLVFILFMFEAKVTMTTRGVKTVKTMFIAVVAIVLCRPSVSVWWVHAGKADLGVLSAQRRLRGEIPAFCLLGDVGRPPQLIRRSEPPRTTQEHTSALYSISITYPYMVFAMHRDTVTTAHDITAVCQKVILMSLLTTLMARVMAVGQS